MTQPAASAKRPFEMVERNMRAAMECFAQATPSSEVRQLPGVTIANAAVEIPVFNAAFLSAPVADDAGLLDRCITSGKVYFDARRLPWSFWLCQDLVGPKLLPRADAAFERRGMQPGAECPGMFAQSLAPPVRPLPALEIRPVNGAETRLAFCHITSVCFNIPFEVSLAIYSSRRTWGTGFTAHVGYMDGEPVATVATLFAGGAIGLYSVATLPDWRGRGAGEAMTRHALQQARVAHDADRFVLQSTPLGWSMYLRMGFRQVTTITVYVAA